MNEPAVTDKIVKGLNGASDTFARKRHSGKFGSGEPDITGCCLGKAFYIEVKMITGALTLLQAHQLTNWREAGAFTALAIYDPGLKLLKIIQPDESETWDQFVAPGIIKELWAESLGFIDNLSGFDWEGWVRTYVWREGA